MIPGEWEFALLAVAAFRIWHLLAEDTILDRPRKWALGLPRYFDPTQDDVRNFPRYREHLATFLTCPWCAGFWIAAIVWICWLAAPTVTLIAVTPWALSAVVPLLSKTLGE